MEYAAIVFDCDGTLVDSMPAHFIAWRDTLLRHGLTMTEETFYAWGGWPTLKVATELVRQASATVDPQIVADEKEAGFAEHLETVILIEETARVVREHHGRIPLAVATGATRPICEGLLRNTGLISLFETIVTCDDITRHKPEPDIYLEAARRLGVDPTRCLAYEDTDPGLEAARRAGMQVVDVRTYYQPRRISELANDLDLS